MPHIVNDRVAWSVGLSVGVSPSEPCRKFGSDRDSVCVQDSGGPGETVAYSGPIRANTALRPFNTMQPSSLSCHCLNVKWSRLLIRSTIGSRHVY